MNDLLMDGQGFMHRCTDNPVTAFSNARMQPKRPFGYACLRHPR